VAAPRRGAPPAQRVRRAALAVPVAAVSAGTAIGIADVRAGLFAAAVVIGWTQLAGL
jgi:hypothetical protein